MKCLIAERGENMTKQWTWITGVYYATDNDLEPIDRVLFRGTRAEVTKHLRDLIGNSPLDRDDTKLIPKSESDIKERDIFIRVGDDVFFWAMKVEKLINSTSCGNWESI